VQSAVLDPRFIAGIYRVECIVQAQTGAVPVSLGISQYQNGEYLVRPVGNTVTVYVK
jgi:hypothetical protein